MSHQFEFLFIDCLIFCFCVCWKQGLRNIVQTGLNSQCSRGHPWAPGSCISTCPMLGLWVCINIPGSDLSPEYHRVLWFVLCFYWASVFCMFLSWVKFFSLDNKVSSFWWLPGPSGWSLLLPCLSKWCSFSLILPLAWHLNCLLIFLSRKGKQGTRVQELILTCFCDPGA